MHPELSYRIAQLRHEELISASRGRASGIRSSRRRFLRRRRETQAAAGWPSPPIVLLRPPPEEHGTAGHDQRVA